MSMRRVALIALVLPGIALAHPLGNFTTNRYAALLVEPTGVRIAYAVDMAELPAYRELRGLDTDGDGRIASSERDAWTPRQAAELARGLELTHDGVRLALAPLVTALEVEPGAGGLPTIRFDVTYRAALAAPTGVLAFRDRTFAGRPGWQEVVATAGDGVALVDSTVPVRDVSGMLRAYPDDLMQAPPRVSEARMALAPGDGGHRSAPSPAP